MKLQKKLRKYERMSITPLESYPGSVFLAESVSSDSLIMSAGQELGPAMDLSGDTDVNTSKTFSHEWDAN